MAEDAPAHQAATLTSGGKPLQNFTAAPQRRPKEAIASTDSRRMVPLRRFDQQVFGCTVCASGAPCTRTNTKNYRWGQKSSCGFLNLKAEFIEE